MPDTRKKNTNWRVNVTPTGVQSLDDAILATLMDLRDGEDTADTRYTSRGGTNFAMKPGRNRVLSTEDTGAVQAGI